MITPGYGLAATERVLPRLALDFTSAALDARITLTRALNTATRVNSSGYIETINANLPRFDYTPTSTPVCSGLLIEESRVNYAPYSEDFTQASWTKLNANIVTGVTGPTNTAVAQKIDETAVLGEHQFYTPVTLTAAQYTLSAFVAKAGRTSVRISLATGGLGYGAAVFVDLDAGTLSPVSNYGGHTGAVATIKPYRNGFYRVTLTITATAALYYPAITNAVAVNTTYLGVVGLGVNVYGVSLELGSFATSYIPNATSGTTTRNADVAVMTGTNFSSWWTSTTGAAAVLAQQLSVSGVSPGVQFDDNTANNLITLRGNTTNPELYIKATTDQAQIDAGTISANTNYGLVGAWNTNDCAAAINGAAAVPDTTATIPTVTQARLGSDGTNYLNGWLQSLRYWPQRIINAETQAFSKL